MYYNYWDRELEKSKVLFEKGVAGGENLEMIRYGAGILERMARDYPEASSGVFRNLGVAYQILAKKEPEHYAKMVAAWRRYLKFNPADDPQMPSIQQVVQSAAAAMTVGAPSKTPDQKQ